MGSYLSQPITEKETEEGKIHDWLTFGAAAMQGWRRSMEDEHIAVELESPECMKHEKASMFGVWDGHGGKEVARFVKKYMHQELVKMDEYNQGEFGQALTKVFHRMDEMLWDESYLEEIESFKASAEAKKTNPTEEAVSTTESRGAAASETNESGKDKTISTDEMVDIFKMLLSARTKKSGEAEEGGEEGGQVAMSAPSSAHAAAPQRCNLPPVQVTAGCTSVVAIICGRRLIVANAGDSRGVMCRGGKALALSEDHKPTQERELARISAVGGFVTEAGRVNGNLNLSRCIGDLKYKQSKDVPPSQQMITAEPDITTFDINPATDEFMILACDGIWDCFTNDVVVEFVRSRLATGMTPVEISKAACDECLADDPKKTQGIGGDNMTCLIIVFKPEGVSC